MPARVRNRQIREVFVDIQKRSTENMALEIQLAALRRVPELPTTIDELVPERAQPPEDSRMRFSVSCDAAT
jgi:hypothetical protein